MNLAEARIVLRPRGPLELLDLAFRYLLGTDRWCYAKLCGLLLLPAYALSVVAHVAGWPWQAVWLLALTLGTLCSGGFTSACAVLLFDPAPRAAVVLRGFAQRLPAYIGAQLLSLLWLLIGALTIVGAPVAWFFTSFLAEAVLLERVGASRAVRRSMQLSRADSGRALALMVSILALSVAMVAGAELLLLAVIQDVLSIPVTGDRLFEEGGSHFALAGYFCSLPWAAAGRFLAYIDVRTRQDGWDLQVRLMARAAEAVQ
ncbi:MAG: hypothetical protein RL685_6284 [Pseudomonadota bacterium]|jgi:hypothetical protein